MSLPDLRIAIIELRSIRAGTSPAPTETMARSRIRLSLIIQLAMILIASPLAKPTSANDQDESWRKSPPRPARAESLKLPASREIRLDNGLTLVMIEDRRSPIVTIQAGVPVRVA